MLHQNCTKGSNIRSAHKTQEQFIIICFRFSIEVIHCEVQQPLNDKQENYHYDTCTKAGTRASRTMSQS